MLWQENKKIKTGNTVVAENLKTKKLPQKNY